MEYDVLGANAAHNVIYGKGYARAILWQLLPPQLSAHLDSVDVELRAELNSHGPSSDTEAISQMIDTLASERFHQPILDFVKVLNKKYSNAEFGWNYMDMVSILLYFTRALYLYASIFRYDHVNYAQWGTVYLAEMAQLLPDILREFQQGTFVVKHANRRFKQVSTDHSTEWLNATGKKSVVLDGITKIASSLNLRTLISAQTKQMFHVTMVGDDDVYTHKECTKGRRMKDDGDEARMVTSLKQHGVFHNKVDTGKKLLNEFVEKRICLAPDNELVHHKAPIRKNKAVTFASLYTVVQDIKGKQITIKMDRNILQRLIMACRAGREVNLDNILQHELMSLPLSLATINDTLHSPNKSLLANILTPSTISLDGPSCLLIDGQALVMALSKSPKHKDIW